MMTTVESPVISIVLGSYNRFSFLRATIASIRRNGISIPYEIIVIDGGSTDGSVNWLVKQKDIITIVQHNHGEWNGKAVARRSWGYFMNIAFKAAHGKYILMISDDNLLIPGAVMNGYETFERLIAEGRKVAALAFYWRNWPARKHYWVGLSLGKMFVSFGMFLRQALNEVGWIDEDAYAFYSADIDLSFRLWHAGYEILDSKESFVEHHPQANIHQKTTNDKEVLIKKWVDIFNISDKDAYILDLGKERTWVYSAFVDETNTVDQFPKDGKFIPFLRRNKERLKQKLVLLYSIFRNRKE